MEAQLLAAWGSGPFSRIRGAFICLGSTHFNISKLMRAIMFIISGKWILTLQG